MKKIDYQREVATTSGLSMVQVGKVMDAMVKVSKLELGETRESKLHGFGTFRIVDVLEKTGRNPSTGETIKIAAHQSVRFKVSKAF